jgi:hypothetical protein
LHSITVSDYVEYLKNNPRESPLNLFIRDAQNLYFN